MTSAQGGRPELPADQRATETITIRFTVAGANQLRARMREERFTAMARFVKALVLVGYAETPPGELKDMLQLIESADVEVHLS